MSTIHFTSDLHLGHPKVADLRGFSSTYDHALGIALRWLDTVGPRDRVYVLGDVTGDSRALDATLALLRALPGEKHLIAGNHDSCHPMNPRAHKALPKYLTAFASVSTAASVKVNGETVLLSHFPYTRDRAETRYPQWRLPHLGKWLLHGHTHGEEKVTITPGEITSEISAVDPWTYSVARRYLVAPPTREIHVGLDAWDLTPVPLDTIATLMKENS